jgi:Flp pilus assembly protein CpaB
MELEYRDPSRRGKVVVAIGLVLALVTGAAAFVLISRAREQSGQEGLQRVSIVVAKVLIPARKPIVADDLEVRDVPIDATNAGGVFSDPTTLIGLVPGVSILAGQPVFANMLASSAGGGAFSILDAGETVGPDSVAWRAVSVTVPDDRAVGGMVSPGDVVDVFVTAMINVPTDLVLKGRYMSDRSTKITYQNVVILAKATTYYVLKVPLAVAEEINHLQASGSVSFSLALRPAIDNRLADASRLGETTNQIIRRYGLPVPEVYPPGNGPVTTAVPTTSPSPATSPSPSPTASP